MFGRIFFLTEKDREREKKDRKVPVPQSNHKLFSSFFCWSLGIEENIFSFLFCQFRLRGFN